MIILVLGTGYQGKATLYDLEQSPDVSHVIAADIDLQDLKAFIDRMALKKVDPVKLDARDPERVKTLMRSAQAVIELLPPVLRLSVTQWAVESGIHVVNSSYPTPEFQALGQIAQERGVAILPECGLDPGIDLVIASQAVQEFDKVLTYNSYGAGIPEPTAADNPLKYKISWTFDGVLASYTRPARLWRDGQIVDIPPEGIFFKDYVHTVNVEGLGELEACPNGDPTRYLEALGIAETVQNAGRYSLRWPGHSELWGKLSTLGFLSDAPIRVGEAEIIPRQFTHDLLLPQLQYNEHERDLALVQVVMNGVQSGIEKQVIYRMIDERDLETGFLAMQRTVGFTASIGAQMLLRGEIQKRGLLSPLIDIPPEGFFSALSQRGIRVQRSETQLVDVGKGD